MGPAIVIALKVAAALPMIRPRLKSGRVLIVSVSAALPRLIVSELVGFRKSVVSIVGPLRRERPLPGVLSSASVMLLAVAGRLMITSAAVPVLTMGSRPL